jgi:hypothetical protein
MNNQASAGRKPSNGYCTRAGYFQLVVTGVNQSGTDERSVWELVAAKGEGPNIPTLPCLAAIRALAAGSLAPGARPMHTEVAWPALLTELRRFNIVPALHREYCPGDPVLQRALRPDEFAQLAPLLQRILGDNGREARALELEGQTTIDGAANALGALVVRLLGLPRPAAGVRTQVSLERAFRDREVWMRRFADQSLQTVLGPVPVGAACSGQLSECFWPFTFQLAARVESGTLVLQVEGGRLLCLQLPRALVPSTRSRTFVDESGRYAFDVDIRAPILGRLLRYRGWLEEKQ